jgi:hypothetical protein
MAEPDNKPVAVVKPPLIAGGQIAAIVPRDFESAYRMAQVIVAAKMAPASLDTPEKACVAIMHGLEVGLTPMAALQSIAVINGMPTIWGDGMLALVRASGLLEEIIEDVEVDAQGEPTIAVCKVKRRGEAQWAISSFTRVEAQRAGLWSKRGPWEGYKSRMLKMRARSWALRDKFADVLRGLHMAEEAMDMGSVSIAPPPREPRRSDAVDANVGTASVEASSPTTDAGPAAAATDSHPAGPPPVSGEPTTPSPETSRRAPESGEPTHGFVGGPAAADARHTPPSEDQSSPDLSMPIEHWTIDGDVIGQANVIARLVKLIGLAETADDVDAIQNQNAARIAKITGNPRANLNETFRIKRESLA